MASVLTSASTGTPTVVGTGCASYLRQGIICRSFNAGMAYFGVVGRGPRGMLRSSPLMVRGIPQGRAR